MARNFPPTREVPEPVWQMLEWIAPRAPNLAGIVYEVMEPAVPLLGAERLTAQLTRLRQIWDTYCPRRLYAVS